jgi:hypothetical protein
MNHDEEFADALDGLVVRGLVEIDTPDPPNDGLDWYITPTERGRVHTSAKAKDETEGV